MKLPTRPVSFLSHGARRLGATALLLVVSAWGLRIESGPWVAEVQQNKMEVWYGPDKIIENIEFFLADKDWKSLFPSRPGAAPAGFQTSLSNRAVRWRSTENPMVLAGLSLRLTPEGLRFEAEAEVKPHSGAYYLVCDIALSRPSFSGSSFEREGETPIALNPTNWPMQEGSRFNLRTSNGLWKLVLTAEGADPKWKLRSVCDRTWGPESMKTFTLLYQVEQVPTAGGKYRVSFDAKFSPVPGYQSRMETQYEDRVSAFFGSLLSRAGSPASNFELPAGAALRSRYLAAKATEILAMPAEEQTDPRKIVLIPEPKGKKFGTNLFRLPAQLAIACADDAAYEILSAELRRVGIRTTRAASGAPAEIRIGVADRLEGALRESARDLGLLEPGTAPGPEGYVLATLPGGALVFGGDQAGAFYGVQTLRQLLRSGPLGAAFPEVRISDAPDLAFRGFYLEGGGRAATNAALRKLLRDTYSFFKGNAFVFQLCWEDFRWKSHPEIASSNALPLEALAALVDEARALHLEPIPQVQSLSYVQALFLSHPEIAEDPDWVRSKNNSWCPNNPQTYALVFDLLQELLATTRCRTVHLGHDELLGLGTCPKCRGSAAGDLFAGDVNRQAEWLAARGVKSMIWGDMLLEKARWSPLGVCSANSGEAAFGGKDVFRAVGKIRKDVTIADWHYVKHPTYPTFAYFSGNGYPVVGCPWWGDENNYVIAQSIRSNRLRGVLATDWGFLSRLAPGAGSILGPVYAWNGNMPEPSRLPWSSAAALAQTLLPADRPSRLPGARFTEIALAEAGNRALAGDGEAWFGFGVRRDLTYLPTGKVRLKGVPYRIGPKATLVGKGFAECGLPARSGKIAVSAAAKSLVFLHTLHYENAPDWLARIPLGKYRIYYSDGRIQEVPISGRNVAHWLPRPSAQGLWGTWPSDLTWDSTRAWEGCTKMGERVNLQAYEWINPRPEVSISHLEIEASQGGADLMLALVGLTAVGSSTSVAP